LWKAVSTLFGVSGFPEWQFVTLIGLPANGIRSLARQPSIDLLPRLSKTACLREAPLNDQYRCLCFSPMSASGGITSPLDRGPTFAITPRCFSPAWTLLPKGKMRLPIPELGA